MLQSKIGSSGLPEQLKQINLNAAGIDVGATSHFVAVPVGRASPLVREFKSFTCDLQALVQWLKTCAIETVAMESTGIYWLPLYALLEAEGFEVKLVNARHVKNVPGRKSDVLDCQWLQQLHTYGLLQGSFRPEQEICVLRSYMRQREMLIRNASAHIQHMQKALMQMNIQLHHVLSDVTGQTGLRMIRAIVNGEHNPKLLATLRDKRCKNNQETVEKALEGNYRQEHLFALKQAVELHDYYQSKLAECDIEIEKHLHTVQKVVQGSVVLTEKKQQKKRRKNELFIDIRSQLYQMTGVDLTEVDGLDSHSALRLISEIGTSMEPWRTAKHFGSWLGLAPGTKISGGKILSSKSKQCASRAAAILRVAAYTLHSSHCAIGAFFRRKKAQRGAPKAITATAYKLARIIYTMIKGKKSYQDTGADYYEKQYQQRAINNLSRKAKSLGYNIVKDTVGPQKKLVEISTS